MHFYKMPMFAENYRKKCLQKSKDNINTKITGKTIEVVVLF